MAGALMDIVTCPGFCVEALRAPRAALNQDSPSRVETAVWNGTGEALLVKTRSVCGEVPDVKYMPPTDNDGIASAVEELTSKTRVKYCGESGCPKFTTET